MQLVVERDRPTLSNSSLSRIAGSIAHKEELLSSLTSGRCMAPLRFALAHPVERALGIAANPELEPSPGVLPHEVAVLCNASV